MNTQLKPALPVLNTLAKIPNPAGKIAIKNQASVAVVVIVSQVRIALCRAVAADSFLVQTCRP